MGKMSLIQFELNLGLRSLGWRFFVWMPTVILFRLVQRIVSKIGLCHAELKSEVFDSLIPKRGPRILFVATDNNAASGAFRSLVTLAQLVRDQQGYDPIVVLPYPGTGTALLDEVHIPHVMILSVMWGIIPNEGVHIAKRISTSLWRNHFAVSRIVKVIQQQEVDLVHVNTTYGYVGALAAKKAGVPLVWHLREFVEEDRGASLWHRPTCNQLIASADRVIAISNSIQKKYAKFIPATRLTRIYNGIDTRRFCRAGRRIQTRGLCTFILLGAFDGHKGHFEFCRACAAIAARGVKDFQIWFVGDGQDNVRQECATILEKAGLAERVTYWGFQSRPEDYLEKADIAFMCSRAEAFGRVTVEAMLTGCLVIGANTGGTQELIQDGKTGLLFDFKSGESPDLAEKMIYALEHRGEMAEIALAGQKVMAETMTAERNADEVARVYAELLRKG